MLGVFKLGPLVDGALRNVAVTILVSNLPLRENPTPHVDLSHLTRSKSVTESKPTSQAVLILSQHNGASMWNYVTSLQACTASCRFAIHIHLVVPFGVLPSRTDVMQLMIVDLCV